MARIVRTQVPPRKTSWREYKPFLRIDFDYKCAYCRLHEAFGGTQRNFVVEHFRPRKIFPELALEYSNLYYACTRCNDYKGSNWPTPEQIASGFQFGDPCVEDVFSKHYEQKRDGLLRPRTQCGAYTILHLRLNRESLRACREKRQELLNQLVRTSRILNKARRKKIDLAITMELKTQIETLRELFRPSPPEP